MHWWVLTFQIIYGLASRLARFTDKGEGSNVISKTCIIVLALTLGGCSSSTLVVPTDQRGGISIESFNQTIQFEDVNVLFNDGSEVRGRGVHIEHDSVSWQSTESDSLFHVPVANIHTISTNSNKLKGGLLGFTAGAAGGALAGSRIADGFDASSDSKGLTMALGTAGGAVAGGLIGTIVGLSITKPHVYEFRGGSSR